MRTSLLVVFALRAASHRASHGQALESYLSQLRALVMFFLCVVGYNISHYTQDERELLPYIPH